MFKWQDKYKFVFSDLGAADKVGVNDVGIGIFKKKPYIGLTKEILQNSTDAPNKNLPNGTPVKVRFELIYIDRDEIPDVSHLNDVIHRCYEYYNTGDDGKKLKRIQDAADRYLASKGMVPVLKISDYNTTGLCGVHKSKGSDWSGLVRERSATKKTGLSSGAFGVGKFAPFTFSSLRTIFYSTKNIDGEVAFQGKALLTTFKDQDGREKNNIGLFADTSNEKYDGVLLSDDIAPVFRRDEIGTDIFVLGFEKEEDWKEQSAISVLEYFFYSIYQGNLVVEIVEDDNEIYIDKDNLGEKIAQFSNYCEEKLKDDISFQFTAPQYWNLLSGPCVSIKETFEYNKKKMGEYELYLLVDDNLSEKRVVEMRHAGMRIREDTRFRISTNFTGIFVATGAGAVSDDPQENISSFLWKCENQAHDDWVADEYPEEKQKAKGIIGKIHNIILEAVKKEMPEWGKEYVDAFGLSEYLPNEDDEESEREEEAYTNFKPLSFDLKRGGNRKKNSKVDISMKKNGVIKNNHKRQSRTSNGKSKRNNKRGTGTGRVSEVSISKVRTPYDTAKGEYQITFVADESINNLILGLKIGSDDDNMINAEIVEAKINDYMLDVKNEMIYVGAVVKDEKKCLRIKLSESGRKTLGVKAYDEYED